MSFPLSAFFKARDDMISDPQQLFPTFLFSALLERERATFKGLKRWCFVNYCTSVAQCPEGVAEYFEYFSRSMVYLICGKPGEDYKEFIIVNHEWVFQRQGPEGFQRKR